MSGVRTTGLAIAVLSWAGASALAQPQAAPEKGGRERMIELAHQVTAAAAIDSLPKQLKGFYKAHRAEMPSLALEPEFAARGPERRFLVDRLAQFPFDDLPHTEASLNAKYGEKAQGIGRLPWLVQESYARLVEAMKAQDKEKIMAESDVLTGLIVDLRSPLNLTDNFDGQKTGQHGVWVRIVEKLPQAVGRDLKVSPDSANYLDNPKEYVFSILLASYVWIDNILYLDQLAHRGKQGYGDPYFEDLARRVGPILRQQVLSPAAEDVGSYWYTAWVVAGRPDLK